MTFEVEQKFPIPDPAAVAAALAGLGAKAEGDCQQVDRYFAHPSRDFAATDEALRIRTVGEENFFTYKGPKLDAATKTRREIEVPIEPGRSGAQRAHELITALGFTPVAEVRKRRRRLLVVWEGRKIEVALDRVEEVGDFVELELLVRGQDQIAAAKACLISLAQALSLAGSERRSYLELLLLSRASAKRNA